MNTFEINVERMLARAQRLGLVGATGNPVVIDQMEELEAARVGYRSRHVAKARLQQKSAEVLEAKTADEYVLRNGAEGCWVEMGAFKVHLYFTAEGLVSDIFAAGAENESIASTYAFDSDAEDALCEELGIDLDDVAEWVGLHYRRIFDTETRAKRMEWIQRYHEAHTEATAASHNPHLEVLEEIGYSVAYQLSTASQAAGWVWEAPSDASSEVFKSEEDAVADAWRDAASQAMALDNLSDTHWDTLSFAQQATHIREMVSEDKRVSTPEKVCCIRCGLPTSPDDEGLCNGCASEAEEVANAEAKWGSEHPDYTKAYWEAQRNAGHTEMPYWTWVLNEISSNF